MIGSGKDEHAHKLSRADRIEVAARAVVPHLIDFNEWTQVLRCRICGSERGDFGRLHKPNCVVYELQDALESV